MLPDVTSLPRTRAGAPRRPWLVAAAVLVCAAVTACSQQPPPVPVEHVLTVEIAGSGSGTITSTPSGIDTTTNTTTAPYPTGTTITLTATSDTTSTFDGFTLPNPTTCTTTTPTSCTLTLDRPLTITATFTRTTTDQTADRFDLRSGTAVTGGYVELTAAAQLTSVAALRPGTLVRWSADGDVARVAWVAEASAPGPQVRLELAAPIAPDGLTLTTASAHVSATAPDLGLEVLTLLPAGTEGPWEGAPFAGLQHDHAGAPLAAAYAERPLGDMDGNGILDIRDALLLAQRLQQGGWSNAQRYHGDLDGDDVSDANDLAWLLRRLVDPALPASLHVKPSALPFTQLDATANGPGLVLVANRGNVPFADLGWQAPAGTSVTALGGRSGHAVALQVSLPSEARLGWRPGDLRISGGPGQHAPVRLGHLVVLIAGQSNAVGFGEALLGWPETPFAGVRMLGNDYVWKDAAEPLDDPTGQVDLVSREFGARYSLGTRLGNLLHAATGFETYLIPSSLGGSRVTSPVGAWGSWRPAVDTLDRGTLFGSTVYRARVSANLSPNPVSGANLPAEAGPVTALVWFQGESDAYQAAHRDAFVSATNHVMDAFATEIVAPTIYVQLTTHHGEVANRQQHAIAELQRWLETGFGAAARPGFHMVVSHDLPRSDWIHLSAFGQRLLAERVDLAIREHVLGEAVDGTGPRLEELTWSGVTVRLRTTRTLATGALDPARFTVFEGPPSGDLDGAGYGTNTVAITGVERDPSDPRGVRITLARTPAQTPHVRYMAPPLTGPPNSTPSDPQTWEQVAVGVVRAAQASGPSGIGLPLPAFGPLPATPAP